MPESAKPAPYIRKLLLKLAAALIFFILMIMAVVGMMHNYSESLLEDSQQKLLPAIHDHQRAALNLERLERMGDLVFYGSNIALIRKNALAAQVLAFQPSFNFDPETEKTVQAAFELIREVRRTRTRLLTRVASLSDIEQKSLLQLERTLEIRWNEYKQELFQLQNRIISEGTRLQEQNIQQITDTNRMLLLIAGGGILTLTLILILIGYSLHRHLITPVTDASRALTQLEKQQTDVSLPVARYQELKNIHHAVQRLSKTLLRLHTLATTDSLTGCLNRGYFMEQSHQLLVQAHQTGQAIALIMLDVDHFKRVNDQYGHAVGDQALRQATGWVKELLPEKAFIGRLGGEEFALVLPGSDRESARELSNRIRIKVAEASEASEELPPFTISLGLEIRQCATDDIDHLLSRADKALYQAKSQGRNQVVSAPERTTAPKAEQAAC